MPAASKDSFAAKDTLTVGENSYDIYKIAGVPGLENAEQAAVLAQGAAGEPDPHRGRREHHRRPHPGAGQLGSRAPSPTSRSSSPRPG